MYSLSVLQRMQANQRLRAALLLAILAFCCYGLAHEWPQVQPWIGHLHVYSIAGSLAAAMASAWCMMLAWRRLLADLGSRLPVLVAARVTFVAQLGKYVPGAVWSFAAHVELGHEYQVPRRRGAASVIVALAVAVAVGLLIAAAALPLASPATARRYLPALALVPVIAICLAPPVLQRILNTGLRILRQEPLEQPLSWRGLGAALCWTVAGWLLLGLQAWLLLADVAKDGLHSVLLALGAYSLACTLALLLVVFPNGIGAREFIFVAALAPVLPGGAAVAVALMARVVTTISDLAWGGMAVAIARRSQRPAAAPPGQAEEGIGPGRHRKPAVTTTADAPGR
jgi:Lysylphosphatidylglycerol synthase TM region